MRQRSLAGIMVACCVALAGAAQATPTTNIWNPNTDVQAPGVLHLGIDNYFSVVENDEKPYAFATDIGLTYGLSAGFEVGVDHMGASARPFSVNAKWGLPESGGWPAFAVGVQQVGARSAAQAMMPYALVAKSFEGIGRLTVGGYAGRKSVLGSDNSGVIAAWDRSFGEKWWASVDYAGGNNPYGALAVGASCKLTPKIGILAGYVFFNDAGFNPNDVVTVQVDIDL